VGVGYSSTRGNMQRFQEFGGRDYQIQVGVDTIGKRREEWEMTGGREGSRKEGGKALE